jgi:hypothetical protein
VFGIDVAVLPAALAVVADIEVTDKAIAKRMDRWFRFTGDLPVLGM